MSKKSSKRVQGGGEPILKLLISLPGSITNPAKFFAISFVSDLGVGLRQALRNA